MQRCPHCQFPVTRLAKTCGWCGAELRGDLSGLLSWFPWNQGPAETHDKLVRPDRSVRETPSNLIGIPGMPPLQAGAARSAEVDDPAATRAANSSDITARARELPPSIPHATAPIRQNQNTAPLLAVPVTNATGANIDTLYARRHRKPPPPDVRLALDFPASWIERWWPVLLLALPVLAWMVTQNDSSWSGALDADGKLCLASAVALGMWQIYRRLALRRTWRQLRAPLGVAASLALLSLICSLAEYPFDAWQGNLLERAGNYPAAIAAYQHAGDGADAAQAQIAWGGVLTDRGAFSEAERQLDAGLAHSSGPVHGAGRIALGRLYWLWGNQLLQHGDVPGAVAKWSAAGARAAGTPGGARAVAALAAPQSVTGRAIWQGTPVAGTRIMLVGSWSFSPQSHSLQTTGDQLAATTSADGSFTIGGAKPGVTYALIWQDNAGDTTRVDARGHPIYTVTIRPLQGANLGTITLG